VSNNIGIFKKNNWEMAKYEEWDIVAKYENRPLFSCSGKKWELVLEECGERKRIIKKIITNPSCSRVFKSEPIQLKIENQSKKIENRKKPNKFGCIWMCFCKNRWIELNFRLIFQTWSKPHTYILILIFLFISSIIYYINLLFVGF
jgi:hypothetical protein